MLTPAQLEAMPYELQQLVDQLEDDILESMAQRLAQADFDKEAFAWEMQKAQELTKTREDIVKILSRKTGVMERTIREILIFAAVESLSFDAAIYSMAGLNPLPVVRSPGMQQLLRAGIENTQGVMHNWTRTTANTATKQFEDAMDRAYMQVLSGAFSPGTAVSRAVSKLAKDGIQAVQYPSGHVDHMDVAARRAVRTGVAQTTGKLQEQLAGELGCDLMQITSHLGARPSHAVWQGQIVSRSGKSGYLTLDDIEYGSGQGFKGWNCRHDWYPYIEGLSFSTAELYDLNENREVYEATQKQRALERKVRASKRACVADRAALDAAADSETRAKLAQQLERDGAMLKRRREELKEFVDSYRSPRGGGLVRYSYREKVEGFDRAVASKMQWIRKRTEEREHYLKEVMPTLPKTAVAGDTVLQHTVGDDAVIGVVPKGAVASNVRVIAGYGTSTPIRVAKALAQEYGGDYWKWEKKGGIITTKYKRYDVHWYEYEGVMYDEKVKGDKLL